MTRILRSKTGSGGRAAPKATPTVKAARAVAVTKPAAVNKVAPKAIAPKAPAVAKAAGKVAATKAKASTKVAKKPVAKKAASHILSPTKGVRTLTRSQIKRAVMKVIMSRRAKHA